ncbi:MAG: hypothetical protein SGCHY_003569 [Lobulomycetales sp.]
MLDYRAPLMLCCRENNSVSTGGTEMKTLEELRKLHRDCPSVNRIPIHRDMPADLLTPVSAYLKLTAKSTLANSFLLESVTGGEKIGRYSFLGSNPVNTLRIDAGDCDPLNILQQKLAQIVYPDRKYLADLPDFTGGAVGFISYDCVRFFEPASDVAGIQDPMELPDAIFMFCDAFVIFDHLHHLVKVVSHVVLDGITDIETAYARATESINEICALLESPDTPQPRNAAAPAEPSEWSSNVGQKGYQEYVQKIKEQIKLGNVIQCVPSQQTSKTTHIHPFNAYRRLRSLNPSPYMFYIHFEGDIQLVGASPEMLVKVDSSRHVYTHPIAGTRKRGATPAEDDAQAADLLADFKERSEHIMLVDLGRNDVNRVCKPETVALDSLMHIERYSHVMHIVSHVSGTLRDDRDAYDAFRSVFPAGTVSGAPKISAMRIIYQLEGAKRGVYAGAVGSFGYGGTIDTCIAIRTMVFTRGRVFLRAGGGIVWDSVPEDEWFETVNKLGSNVAVINALEE